MQRRACEQCGTGFSARSSRARFCSDSCRLKAHRIRSKAATAVPPIPLATSSSSTLVESVTATLTTANRAGTPAGHMCILLAEQAADADARALPGLTRELSLRLAEALRGASGAAKDPVDQLRERRERRGVA